MSLKSNGPVKQNRCVLKTHLGTFHFRLSVTDVGRSWKPQHWTSGSISNGNEKCTSGAQSLKIPYFPNTVYELYCLLLLQMLQMLISEPRLGLSIKMTDKINQRYQGK